MQQSLYKVHVHDRTYASWDIFETNKFNKVILPIIPIEHKLFTNDIFSFNNDTVEISHSSIRSSGPHPGVLILDGNKTYGRDIKKNNRGGKLLYKCVPDDSRLPYFLIPYEIKNIGFSKIYKNIYVTFNFEQWDDNHPRGKLDNVIGPVDVLDNFYEYQLYSKSLNASIQKFQKETTKTIADNTHDTLIKSILTKYSNIEDRTNQNIWNIITIDPKNSVDLDDGFSIINLDDNITQLSIYISNVTIWMDFLNLWDSFSRRISTIYLPDKKRPMLPTILSEGLCSLQTNVKRFAFVMDVFVQNNIIINVKYGNAIIKVSHNYTYEEPKLLGNNKYQEILAITQILSLKYKYINNIHNSHDVVCYLMIFMNYHSAKNIINHKTGIFRSTVIKRTFDIPNTLPESVEKFIKIWNSASGQYINGAEIVNTRHELLDVDAYIHITSPIRRLVDLLNMIKFQAVNNLINLSKASELFYDKWLNDLEYINTTMRTIRKVQCDCSLLDTCCNSPEIMDKEYDGYIFDKINKNNGLFQYIVFLPELKLSSRINLREEIENFSNKKFKLYLFNNEDNFKRKIRIHLL